MSESTFNPQDMPILDVDTSRGSLFEASQFLNGPEIISVYLSEAIKSEDPQRLIKALNQIAKSEGINKLAQAAGVNRESLYKTLKGGDKTRLETIKKLLKAVGVELTVQPITADVPAASPAKRPRAAAKQSATANAAMAAKPA